jgi:hypothetical protein
LPAVAQPARIDAAGTRDPVSQRLHQVGRRPVVPEHHHVQVDARDFGVEQDDRRHVVERADHPAAGQHRGRLLGGAALGDRQRVGATLVETERVHAVDNDLAAEGVRERGEQFLMPVPGHRDDYHIRLAGRVGVGHAADPPARAKGPGRGHGPLGAARSDDHWVARGGEPVRQATALVPGPAQDTDHEIGDIFGHNG